MLRKIVPLRSELPTKAPTTQQYSFAHSSVALQPFVGPRPLFQFRDLFYTDGRTPWSAGRKAATFTQDNTNTDIHALSGIRTHDPSVRANVLDRAATVTGIQQYRTV
jgi:hypothetical protein